MAIMEFFCLAVMMAIRTNISLVLTQMVYVPNLNANVSTHSNNASFKDEVEVVCPIKYTSSSHNYSAVTTFVVITSFRRNISLLFKKVTQEAH